MRLAVFCFVLLRMCGADLSPNALVSHHGGVVVGAGDRAVEVLASSDGAVEAWVVDAEGAPIVASPDPITLTLTAEGGARTPVVVVWDPTSTSYKATAPVPIVAGPVDVQIVVDGEPRGGHLDTIVILPAMAAEPQTTVVVDAPRPRTGVRVERPEAPGVIVVAPPPPRPGVVVVAPEPPRPPGVVIVGPRAPSPPGVVVYAPEPPRPPGVVVVGPRAPSPPGVVVVGPRAPSPPGVVVVGPRPPSPGVVVVGGGDDDDDDDDRGRRHGDRGLHLGHDSDGRGHGRGH